MWKRKSNLKRRAHSERDKDPIFFERMEPRILFSADALSGLVAADPFSDVDSADSGLNIRESASLLNEIYAPAANESVNPMPATEPQSFQLDALQAALDGKDSVNDTLASLDTLGALLDGNGTDEKTRQEIIFVDAATPDYQQLLTGLNTDTPGTDYQIFILQSDRDGIEQITEILASFDAIDAIHLVSHGNETGLQLGDGWLGQGSIDDYAGAIDSWSSALSEEADLLIYGCNLAANASGQQLIDSLANLTTADVAASDDLTGAATLDGDWELEYQRGETETDSAFQFTSLNEWQAVLSTQHLANEVSTAELVIKSDENWGQSFTHNSGSGTYTVDQIELLLSETGGADNLITVTLKDAWSGAVLGSGSLTLGGSANPPAWHSFNFAEVTLTDGVEYFIRVDSDLTTGDVRVGYDGGASFAGGELVEHVGSTDSGKDLTFRVSGSNSANAVDDSYATNENTILTVGANGVLANDSSLIATPGATLEYIAVEDTDGNSVWEDVTGVAGYDFDFTGSDVIRNDNVSNAQAGISAAYEFASVSPSDPNLGISPDLFADLPGNPTAGAATFEFWIRPTDASGAEMIFDIGDGTNAAGTEGASLRLNGSVLEWVVWDDNAAAVAFTTLDISAEIASGKFIQVIATIDPNPTNTVTLSVNGGPTSTGSGSGSGIDDWESPGKLPSIGDNNGLTRILNPTPGTEPFTGEIAIFRFYESVLSAAEIQKNFDSVYFSVVSHDATSALGATVVVNGDGSFSYDPGTLFESLAGGETLVDTFTYTMEDSDSNQDTATVSVTINGFGNGVSVTATLTDSTLEDTDLVFSVANGNEITVDDGTTDDEILRTTVTVTNGTVTLATTAGLTSVTGDGTGTIVVIGLESDINNALDGLTYTPTNNYSGPADLTVTTDLQADLLGFYEFEVSGDIGDDTSPSGTNDGAVFEATQINDGTRGNVLQLDGIDDSITIPGRFGDPQSVTLAAWVQLDAAAGSGEVISLGDRVILRLDETFSGLGVFGSFYDGSNYLTTSSNTFIAGTGWHHVAYTLDGTANEQTLYIDGVAVDTTTHAPAVVYSSLDSTLGRNASSASYFFMGELDDARIYDRALSAGEIQAIAIDQFNASATVSIMVDPVNDAPSVIPSPVFINELHYDNAGIDTGEAIEIMGVAGTDLSGWDLVLYNGLSTTLYDTVNLSGIIADQSNGYGTVVVNFPVDGIQNDMDGIALVNASSEVVQFISYEGVFTATDGPAAGLTSTDIGVAEDFTTAIGDSLQLTGTGSEFTWAAASASSFGSINTGQNVFAFDTGTEDTDNVYNHSQMLALLGASDIDDADSFLTINISNVVNGSLTLGGVGTGGPGTIFTFTPDPDFSGQLTFDYQVLDDDLAASNIGNGIINIAAVDDPINVNTTGNTVTFTEDAGDTSALFAALIDTIETGDTISQLVLNLADVEAGDTLLFGATSIDLNTNGATGPDAAGFTYTVSSAGASPVVTISHAGTDDATVNSMLNSLVFNNSTNNDPSSTARTVTLTSVTDSGSGLTADGTVATVNVLPVNDAPTAIIVPTGFGVDEDDGYRMLSGMSVSDPDAGSNELAVTLSVNDGVIRLGNVTGLTFTTGSNESASMTFTGTLTDLNTALGTLAYQPDPNYAGTDTLSLTVNDQGNSGGGALINTNTVDIVVSPINDAPTTTPVVLTPIVEDSGVRVITQAELLVNANDDDGDTLTAAGLTISSGSGTLADNGDGTWNFTPALNDDTSVSFSYTISDGTAAPIAATASLDITPVNDAPTTTPVVLAPIAEDSGVRLITQADLLANANDDDGDTLTAAGLTISSGSGTLADNGDGTWNYTPALNDDTSVSFSYTISDGTAAPIAATASLDITPVNDAPTTTPVVLTPIAEDSGVRLITQAQLLVNANDNDGDALTAASLAITSGSGTLVDNGDGTWNYTPAINDDTGVSFIYTISDGTAAPIAATASLDITPVNDAPTTTPVVLAPIAEDSGVRLITQADLLANANDDDGDTLTAASLAITAGSGSLVDNLDGTWDYTPALNDDTSVSFSYTISDGTAAPIAATSSLDITPQNDAPTTTPVVLAPIAEDSGVRLITQADLLINANDDDGDTLTAASLAISSGSGTLLDNGDGTWNYTPALNDDTGVSFSYTISDGTAAPIAATASLDITPVNDAPTTTPVVLTPIAEDSGVRLITQAELLINANDNDGDILTAAGLTISSGSGTLLDNGDGTWNYSPALNDDSSVSFSYTISDGTAAPIAATASLDITPVNDAPTGTTLVVAAVEETATAIDISGNVSDVDGTVDLTTTTVTGGPSNGSLTNNGDGTFSYTGNTDFVGSDSFTYTVEDNDGQVSADITVMINVSDVNDAPTATNLNSSSSFNEGNSSVALNDIVITDIDNAEMVTATLTLANTDAGSLSANDGASYDATTGIWTISGSVANVNLALANVSFNPSATDSLNTTVAVSIDDGDEDSSGPLIGTLTITAIPVSVVDDLIVETSPDETVIETEPELSVEETADEPDVVEATITEPVVEENVVAISASGEASSLEPSAIDKQDFFFQVESNKNNTNRVEISLTQKTIEPVLVQLREQLSSFDDALNFIDTESFIMKLNDLREEEVLEKEQTEKVVGGSLSLSAGLSVGYVIWLARSGVLLSSVLSSLPAWRFIDPLPVLASLQSGKDDDEESLESIVKDKESDQDADTVVDEK